MSSSSAFQTQHWFQSFQDQVPFLHADEYTSNVRVLVGGPYSIIKLYGRGVPSPRKGTEDTFDTGDSGRIASSGSRRASAGAPALSYSPQPRTAAQNRSRHAKSRKTELGLLINQNFDPRKSQLVTLTFRDQVISFAEAKRAFQSLLRRLRKNVDGIKYVGEPERQSGRWHLHLIVDRMLPLTAKGAAPYILRGVIRSRAGSWERLWPYGQVHQKRLDNGGNLGASLADYLIKNSNDPELAGHHTFWRSDNLEPYAVLYGYEAVAYAQELADRGEPPVHAYFLSGIDFIGTLNVYEFCRDRQAALYDQSRWRYAKAA